MQGHHLQVLDRAREGSESVWDRLDDDDESDAVRCGECATMVRAGVDAVL